MKKIKVILELSAVTIRINGDTIEITGKELANIKEEKHHRPTFKTYL